MEGGDANFVTSATVAGSLGDVIIGSATGGNVLGGSIGNDVFTSNVTGLADTIFTNGGADKITLMPGHTGSNSLDMYSGFSTAGVTPGTAEIVRFGSITNANDVPDLGWFGQATGVVAKGYDATGNTYAGLAANTGVSAANSTATTITNFNAGSDIIQLSDSTSGYGVGVGGPNGVGGVTIQLVNASLAQFTAAGVNGTPVNVQQVNPGDTLTGANNFFELTTGTFATATAVAAALHCHLQLELRGQLRHRYIGTYLRRLLRRDQRAHRGCGLDQQLLWRCDKPDDELDRARVGHCDRRGAVDVADRSERPRYARLSRNTPVPRRNPGLHLDSCTPGRFGSPLFYWKQRD